MRKMTQFPFVKILSVIVWLMAASLISGQDKPKAVDKVIIEERIQHILADIQCKGPESDSRYQIFRKWLKDGVRGDGIHHEWMNHMKQLGVREASFVVHSSWKKGAWRFKVEKVAYFQEYYCYEGLIKDGRLLREIHKSGLERQLKEAIIEKLKRREQPLKPEEAKEQEFYPSLLDDEYLPTPELVY